MKFLAKLTACLRSPWAKIGLLLSYALSPFYLVPLMDREANYAIMEPRFGQFQWHRKAIFEEDGHVDHLFIGNSALWSAVNPLELEAELERQSGGVSSATVLNLSHNWNGSLLDYALFAEFLKHRSCDVVYFSVPDATARPHSALKYIFDWRDLPKTSTRVPARAAIQIYAEQLLIIPRLLTHQVFRMDEQRVVQKIVDQRGHQGKTMGFRDPNRPNSVRQKFREDLPLTVPGLSMASFSSGSPGLGDNSARKVPIQNQWQQYICDLISSKAKEHGVTVVFVDTPKATFNSDEDFADRIVFSPDSGHGFQTISIPEQALFSAVSREDSQHYFYDYQHVNDAGATLFSRTLAAIIHQGKLDHTP